MEVVIEGPTYYDKEDEAIFFACLYSLPDYKEVIGKGRKLHIQLKEPVTEKTIIQLLILCRRWRIDIAPLLKFRHSSNNDIGLWEQEIE